MPEAALRRYALHHLLERHVLVRIRTERRRAHGRQVLDEGRLRAHLPAHHQRVHEEPDEPFQLAPRAVGDRRAHRDVGLPAVPPQQHLERREQRHEQRRAVLPAQRLQLLAERRVDRQRQAATPVALHRGPRPIRRQLEQRRQVCELGLPVRQLPLELTALEPCALPRRIAAVGDHQIDMRQQRAKWNEWLDACVGRNLDAQARGGCAASGGDDQQILIGQRSQRRHDQVVELCGNCALVDQHDRLAAVQFGPPRRRRKAS